MSKVLLDHKALPVLPSFSPAKTANKVNLGTQVLPVRQVQQVHKVSPVHRDLLALLYISPVMKASPAISDHKVFKVPKVHRASKA